MAAAAAAAAVSAPASICLSALHVCWFVYSSGSERASEWMDGCFGNLNEVVPRRVLSLKLVLQ